MKTYSWLLGLPFLMGMTVGVVVSPVHAESTWVLNNCDQSSSFSTTWTRDYARSYASSANGDGYDWGGGCWNGDGVDNTPNQDTDHNTEGEGADCSGLVHKSWALANDGSTTRRYWPILSNKQPEAHGPYVALDYHNGVGPTNVLSNKNYGTTIHMDAFASSTHIGMIYSEGSGGSDTIIESKDQQTNTGIFVRNYRSLSGYDAVRRAGWDS